MKRGTVRALAAAIAMSWGIAQAQPNSENSPEAGIIPPPPGSQTDDEAAAPPQPGEIEPLDTPGESNRQRRSPEAANEPEQVAPSPESLTEKPPPGLAEEGESGPSRSRPSVLPPKEVVIDGELKISPRVRRATAHLNIPPERRARYRWHDGQWWFKSEDGQWLYFRNGQWNAFDPDEYQSPARPDEIRGPGPAALGGYSPGRLRYQEARQELSPSSVNGYYYEAPSYRPVPPLPAFYYYGPRGPNYGPPRYGPYPPRLPPAGYWDGGFDPIHRSF